MFVERRTIETRQAGQSMVEVAIALPFLIAVVIGLVEIGIVFASYIALVNSAREGAIYASMNTNLVDSSCGSSGNSVCVGLHDNDPANPSATQSVTTTSVTTTLWEEYSGRVANDVLTVIGEPMRGSQLLQQDILTVDRPIPAPTLAGSSCPISATTTLDQGCPLTITVHYQVQTLLSGLSLPYFNRLGLPSYYQISYSMGMPIR